MTWLKSKRRKEDTLIPVTPTTHMLPPMNEVSPDDPTVIALTSESDDAALPPVPARLRGR